MPDDGIAAFGGVFINGLVLLAGSLGVNPALVILGALLVVAWRNAGWIGLDRWFIPWTHRAMFAKPSGGDAEMPPEPAAT
jgi:thiosulfate dehydrogenase [quinone] large subunit